jgi:hypothetical protein
MVKNLAIITLFSFVMGALAPTPMYMAPPLPPRPLEFMRRPHQLRFPRSHPNRPLQIRCPRCSDDSPRLPHRRGARLFQAVQKTRSRLFHNRTARPVPPPQTVGGGLRLLHVSVAAAWPCPPSWTPTPTVCLTFGTYTCNMCAKHMQHLDKTIAT